jgi:hypothetical protein
MGPVGVGEALHRTAHGQRGNGAGSGCGNAEASTVGYNDPGRRGPFTWLGPGTILGTDLIAEGPLECMCRQARPPEVNRADACAFGIGHVTTN